MSKKQRGDRRKATGEKQLSVAGCQLPVNSKFNIQPRIKYGAKLFSPRASPDPLFEKVRTFILQNGLLEKRDRVVVGVSGGADSVCLLHLMAQFREPFQLCLFSAHLNHKLRGKESDKDLSFVRSLSRKLRVPFYSENQDVRSAKMPKESLQMAARRIRFEFFKKVAKKTSAAKIALAHNMNDNAETIVMRFVKGCGPDGLSGIPDFRREGRFAYIRPMLQVQRTEIEHYLQKHALLFREDSSNMKKDYLRNKIRLELLPQMLKFNKKFIHAAARLSSLISEENAFLEQQTQQAFKNILLSASGHSGELTFERKSYLALPGPLRKRVLRHAVFLLKNVPLSHHHVFRADSFLSRKSGKVFQFPEEVLLMKNEKTFSLKTVRKHRFAKTGQSVYNLPLEGKERIPEFSVVYTVTRSKGTLSAKATEMKNRNSIFVDMQKCKSLRVRARCPGDRFMPSNFPHVKKLKDYFIDEKVNRELRDRIPLVIAGSGEIVWVTGKRQDERFKATKNSKSVCEVSYTPLRSCLWTG